MSSATQSSLTPDISPIDKRRWQTFLCDDELKCHSFYLPHSPDNTDNGSDGISQNDSQAFTTEQLNKWYQQLHPSNYQDDGATSNNSSAWTDASYQNQLLLRKTAWHTFNPQCTCEYGYSDTWQPLIASKKMMSVLEEITNSVSKVIGLQDGELDCVNLNYYPEGGGVGWHADDEYLFDGLNRGIRIVSLSLCAPSSTSSSFDCGKTSVELGARKFQVKQKPTNHHENDQSEYEIILKHGDILTMEGMFQRHYLHSVWPGDSKEYTNHELCQGERINLTWRTIVRHLDGSDECRGLVCPLASSV